MYICNDEKGTIYNIEMQNSRHANLFKRSRYYQGMIDLNLLEPGDDYGKLERSYIIFICTFDLFGKGRHIYTFENRCVEELDLVLPDEAVKVFINTTGSSDDIDEEVLELLKFFNGELPTGEIARAMQEEVNQIKKKEEWRVEYMTMMELERERFREGMEYGMEHAREKYLEGREEGIRYSVKQALKYGASMDDVINDIMMEYDMTEEQVKSILNKNQ